MTDLVDRKKYNSFENVLCFINKKTISLCEDHCNRNNVLLHRIIEQVIMAMKEKSDLFKGIFREVFYGGSYYDGLKIGSPDEYDLDLLLCLPKASVVDLIPIPDVPGFVQCKISGTAINEFTVDGNITTTKVLSWMESLVTKAMQAFTASGTQYEIIVNNEIFYAHIVKSGPAFTLKIVGNSNGVTFDVDLVPCFIFDEDKWPLGKFKQNKTKEKSFFIVPKQPKYTTTTMMNLSWRLSFQKQERVLISDLKNLKPAVKLLKKLRDRLNHKSISSYYIKTVVLWETETRPKRFWESSLSFVFMELLQVYCTRLEEGIIPYFWNKENNLISCIKDVTLTNMTNRINNIIDTVNQNLLNPLCIADLFLSIEDIEVLKNNVMLSKKCAKPLQSSAFAGNDSDTSSKSADKGESRLDLVEILSTMNRMCGELAEVRNENRAMCLSMVKLMDKLSVLESKLDEVREINDGLVKQLQQKSSQKGEKEA